MMMRHLILGLLRHRGAQHGYALMKEYANEAGRALSVGNYYRELQRLHAHGLVRPVENPPDADPRRLPYEITALGVSTFDAWLRQSSVRVEQPEDEQALRVFFAMRSDVETAASVLAAWRAELVARREHLERKIAESARHDDFATLPMCVRRRIGHIDAELEFIETVRAAHESCVRTPQAQIQERRHAPRAGSKKFVETTAQMERR